MSLSWRDQLTAFVAPGSVRVAVASRGWWPRRRVTTAQPAAGAQGTPENAGELAGMGLQLGDALRAHAGRAFDIGVVLSNHFVRYAVVDNASQLRGAAERAIAGSQALRAVHGSAVDEWQVVMDDDAMDGALVAGVPRALVDALHGACRLAGAHRISIEPLLARSLNDARAQIGSATGWLGVMENGRLVLASIGAQSVTAVRSQRLLQDPATEVAALVQRTRLLDGMPATRSILLLASDQPLLVGFPPESGLQLRTMPLRCMPAPEVA
ncbi:MAG: hypothetical protein ACJ8GO_08630 [Ramlibacter sp.]